jgi:hypothetical protein
MLLTLLAALAPALAAPAAPAPPWLAPYDDVRAGLVADKLPDAAAAATRLAAALPDPDTKAAAGTVAAAPTLDAARAAFGDLSRTLLTHAAAGEPAYALPKGTPVFHCTMTACYGYWFQDEGRIGNPYEGKAMPRCGDTSSVQEAAAAPARPAGHP